MQELRPYQARDVVRIREAFRRARAVCYVCPTGGGKTTVAAEVCRRTRDAGGIVWMLVHRDELVDQAATRLAGQGVRVGVLRAGGAPEAGAEAHVVSIATAARRVRAGRDQDLPPKPRLALIDECHHATADSWRDVVRWLDPALRLGLTATPERLDGAGLGDVFDALVVGPTPEELVAEGAIVAPRIWTGPTPNLDGIRTLGGDFSAPEVATRAAKLVGDVVETWHRRAAGLSSIVFAVNVPHSLAIRDAFRARGVTCEHVDGTTPKDERRAIFERFRAGELMVVTNVGVVTEGFDVPDMRCVVLARPTLSLCLYLQMVGRGLRASAGKDHAIILDHGFNAARHGDPLAPRAWALAPRRRRRKEQSELALRNGGDHYLVCESCLLLVAHGVKVCPGCGKPTRDSMPVVDETKNLVVFDPVAAEAARKKMLTQKWHTFRAMARKRQWHPRQALGIWRKQHGGKGPLELGLLETARAKQEFLLWLRAPPTKSDARPLSDSKQTSLL